MKLLFIVQGEGRGHLTQALTLEKMLLRNGHQVVKMLVGKSHARRLPDFFLREARAEVDTFDSPNFLPSRSNRGVGHLRSTLYNTVMTPTYMRSIWHIASEIRRSGADLVINFYEILCGLTYGLFRPSVPEVCIGHQYLFLHPDFTFPERHPYAQWWLRFFTRMTGIGATRKVALSIRPYADDADERIVAVPPLLRTEVTDAVRHHGDYITGYILNAGYCESVMAWHRRHPEVRMQFFWDKKGADPITRIDDTLSFHTIDDKAFIRSLADCRAYATTGGFESVCEALYMGKPVMMVPVHIEQECNVHDAEREGVGIAAEEFDIDRLIAFSRTYSDDVEFRMWENQAESRIVACLEGICAEVADTGHAVEMPSGWFSMVGE